MWPFKKKKPIDPVNDFWQWFSANSPMLLAMDKPHEPTMSALHNRLKAIHSDLVFEFEIRRSPRAFVVSADGNRQLFSTVLDVVKQAPDLPGWTVLAFRQPGPTNVTIEMGSVRLGPDDIWFTAEPHAGRIGIRLFVRGYDDASKGPIQRALFLLLDNALGEFLTETAIGYIEYESLPDDPQAKGLRPFTDLPDAVGSDVPTSSN